MKKLNREQISNIVIISLIAVSIILGYLVVDNKQGTPNSTLSSVIATTTFKTISYSDLVTAGGVALQEVYKQKDKIENEVIYDFLIEEEAKKNNMNKVEFLNKYTSMRIKISDASLNEEFEKVKINYPSVTIDQVRNKLRSDQYILYKNELVKELAKKYELKITLPTIEKVLLDKNQYQEIRFGASSAAINLVVFSDYKCKHCKTFHNELKERMKQHPDKINVEYRHFPIMGSFSKNLALYGYCMNKQEKYLEYSDLVYKYQDILNYNNLLTTLSSLNYDKTKLQSCLKSSMPNMALNQDLSEVQKLNISSTPKILINGYVGNLADLDNEIEKVIR